MAGGVGGPEADDDGDLETLGGRPPALLAAPGGTIAEPPL